MPVSFDIKANLRKNLGSNSSRRDIKAGLIPAVICNKNGDNLYITVNSKELEKEYFKGNIFSTIVNIGLDDKNLQVIPNKIDVDPVTDRPIHINFIKFEKDKKVKVKVKLNFINKEKSKGLKKGGFLNIILRKVELICDPSSIPDFIEVDVEQMNVGDKIRTTELKLPKDTQLSGKNGFTVVGILGRGTKDTAEDANIAGDTAEGKEDKENNNEGEAGNK